MDFFPTVAKITGAEIPKGTVLNGLDISDILTGKKNNVIDREKKTMWRGGNFYFYLNQN